MSELYHENVPQWTLHDHLKSCNHGLINISQITESDGSHYNYQGITCHILAY